MLFRFGPVRFISICLVTFLGLYHLRKLLPEIGDDLSKFIIFRSPDPIVMKAKKNGSSWDPDIQSENIDGKIVAAFQKIAETFRVMQWNQAKQHGISPIQLQILIFLQYHDPETCTVVYLAQEFSLTKATVSDAVKSLFGKKLVRKVANPTDNRSYYLMLTKAGKEKVKKVEHYSMEVNEVLSTMIKPAKNNLYQALVHVVDGLNEQGLISLPRMCYNCQFYEGDKDVDHHCHFLKKTLAPRHVRMDCPEFEPVEDQVIS